MVIIKIIMIEYLNWLTALFVVLMCINDLLSIKQFNSIFNVKTLKTFLLNVTMTTNEKRHKLSFHNFKNFWELQHTFKENWRTTAQCQRTLVFTSTAHSDYPSCQSSYFHCVCPWALPRSSAFRQCEYVSVNACYIISAISWTSQPALNKVRWSESVLSTLPQSDQMVPAACDTLHWSLSQGENTNNDIVTPMTFSSRTAICPLYKNNGVPTMGAE